MSTRTAPAYPVRVRGTLDPGLSRWLWLVKWLLVIPHVVALTFLWMAFVVLSVIAAFAILFTGRYPRGIFDLVLRMDRALLLAASALILAAAVRGGHAKEATS
jgi:hypothetical protein